MNNKYFGMLSRLKYINRWGTYEKYHKRKFK